VNQRILLIDNDSFTQSLIKDVFVNERYDVVIASTGIEGLKKVYSDYPSLVLVNYKLPDINGLEIVKEIRKNPLLSHLPIVMIIDLEVPSIENQIYQVGVNDCIKKPISSTVLLLEVRSLLMKRTELVSNITPTLNLPGSYVLQKEIEEKLEKQEKFGILYCEISNFEYYNEIYGSQKSEEVIKFTFNIFRQSITYPSSKIFHITTNSFCILCLPENVSLIGNRVVESFNKGILNYYSKEDEERGCLVIKEQNGNLKNLPLMNICVVGASNVETPFSNYGEVAKVMFELINYAKRFSQSIFIMNRRKRV